MPRNAPFGIAAGSPNYAQGGSGNRFRLQDHLIRQARAVLFGEPMMQVLPTFAPFAWAWSDNDSAEPEDAIAAGAGESMDRNIWGGMYYGYHPYEDQGYPARYDDASYTEMPIGYTDPLFDPDQDLWHYSAPTDIQAEVQSVDPWEAAHARAATKNHATHDARSPHGRGRHNHTHESINFDGTSG